jgi:hypothetical protein
MQLQPESVQLPLVKDCGPSSADIVCVQRYASVMPYHFFREQDYNKTDVQFGNTSIPNDPSFSKVYPADFVVFDEQRGLNILGSNPTYEVMFQVTDDVHEAPVYVASLNKLFVSRLSPSYLPQLVVDLNQDPPTQANISAIRPSMVPTVAHSTRV